MSRYNREFMGISGHPERPGGADPNYRDGYSGVRMRGGPGQAAYGHYRWRHQGDLGFERGVPMHRYGYDYDLMPVDYGHARRMPNGGGVHDVRYDDEFMRDFNAESPLFRGGSWRQRRGGGAPGEQSGRTPPYDTGYRPQYGQRGMSSSGYSQPWARGPMRGNLR